MEPRVLRLVNTTIKSIEIDTGKRKLKFGKGITTHTIEADEDVSHLNRRDFVVCEADAETLLKWYRLNSAKKETGNTEMNEEEAVAFLKSKGYLAYKKGQKSNES